MEESSPRMTGGTREAPVNISPAVAAHAEGEEIEVLESTDILPVAPEEVQWKSLFDKLQTKQDMWAPPTLIDWVLIKEVPKKPKVTLEDLERSTAHEGNY
ncbi:hypothetical protein AMECASPLE_004141 [Ameca splendens]|uniref:Uncharacterized protein n=1 Tax=Ameca splendens TaxID=208324 RepID=A0ABV0Y9Z4_9TELE